MDRGKIEALRMPFYQCDDVMDPLEASLAALAKDGEKVIRRGPFRWTWKCGDQRFALGNHNESDDIHGLAEYFGYEVVADFNHIALIRPMRHWQYGKARGENDV